ncbi:MAG: PEGA domain-containing protein [Gammaproteobacteria bacterium]
MEYLLVKFRENRRVVVDDHYLGSTNQVLELEEGQHSISLAAPYDFKPHEWRVILTDSTVVQPIEVEFT